MSFYKFLVPKIEVTISVVRTYEQEVAGFIGKNSEAYLESSSICLISEKDLDELGVKTNTNVKVSTKWGSVVLKAVKTLYAIRGIIFIPIGLWANQIIPADFEDDGHIKYKNLKGYIETTEEKVKSYEELKKLFIQKEK